MRQPGCKVIPESRLIRNLSTGIIRIKKRLPLIVGAPDNQRVSDTGEFIQTIFDLRLLIR